MLKNDRKRRAIIVLGMHRTGTSALAGVLGLLGARLPSQLMPASSDNPKGFFEPKRIVAIHDRILAAAGTTWSGWEEIPEAWFLSEPCRAFVDELVEAVSEDYGTADLCVIKDPRMCRLMPLWYRVLDRIDVKPCFAIPLRNPVEVAKSLQNRNELSLAHGCLLWLRHVLDAERHTRGHPRVFLRYRDLLAGPGSVIDRMRKGLGIAWPRPVKSSLGEIEDFLDPSLRTQIAHERDIDHMGDLSPWLRQAYECCEALVHSPTDRAARRRLDSLHAAFAASDAAFTPVFKHQAEQHVSELAALRDTLTARQKDLATLHQALADRDYQVTALGNALVELDTRAAALDRKLAEREAKIVTFGQALTESEAKVETLDRKLAEREAKIVTFGQALAESEAKVETLDRKLAEREAKIVTFGQALAEREAKVATLDQALAERHRELGRLRDALAERDTNIAMLQSTVAALQASTSWLITAPLRWAKRMLGRLRYSAAGYLLELGWRALRARSRAPFRDWRAVRIIAHSGLFDNEWYLKANPDVAAWHVNPVRHYVAFGAREGRDPSPSFSTRGYLSHNPDVSAAGLNPLSHFILHGASEGRVGGNGSELRSALQMTRRGWMGNQVVNISGALALLREAIRLAGGVTPLAVKSWRVLRAEGIGGLRYRGYSLQHVRVPTLDRSNRTRPVEVPPFGYVGIPAVAIPDVLANAQRWCMGDNPKVSVLIVNWNAAQLTLECVRQIWANTEDVTYEIIIVDNGSDRQSIMPLKKLGSGTRLLELGANRYFGEANNIAAEQATGKYLCFLNNDAFVRPGWLRSLVEELDKTPEAGAVGPMFLFPNNTLQEAGSAIDENGYPTRFGRNLDPALPEFNVLKFVDYISAAALLMEKQLFIKAGGFDLAYEPAYYEDTDLCFKLLAMGRKTRYCPTAKVIHIEGSSANDNVAAQERRKALGELNRDKFVGRWGTYLKRRSEDTLLQLRKNVPCAREQEANSPALLIDKVRSGTGSVAIFTPFALTPGGGERYILTLGAALANHRQVTIVTPHPYSHVRLYNLGREFELDLSQCDLTTYERFACGPRPEFMFTLGNHIVPPVPAHAANSWYHCQFPFPIEATALERSRNLLVGYRGIIVNSDFTKEHALRALNVHKLPSIPIEIIHPPAPTIGGDAGRKKNIILSVGRFFVGGHSKRQDIMIAAFRDIIKSFRGEIELHLAGSSMPETLHMVYLSELQKMALQLPVKIHVNPTQEVLWDLYRDAAIYWHGTGLQCDIEREPEKAEHFGISIVEAMSAECVPLAYNAGGPREIIKNGVDGFLYDTTDSLVELTLGLLRGDGAARRIEMGRAAGVAAGRYTVERFTSNVRRLIDTAG